MIEKETFAYWIGVLADRFNRSLTAPTTAEYYRACSRELDTNEFIAGAQRAFAESRFWPSPWELVELAKPSGSAELKGAETFADILRWNGCAPLMSEARTRLDATAMRAFLAVGGPARFRQLTINELPFVRKEFVAAYSAACRDATEAARADLALGQVSHQHGALGARHGAPESLAALMPASVAAIRGDR